MDRAAKNKKHLVIVGGGASGAITLIQACAYLNEEIFFTIIEPNDILGLGLAYSTNHDDHILNVPVEKMSLFAERPADFAQWIESQSHLRERYGPQSYVPRHVFGSYVRSQLALIHPDRYRHVKARVDQLKRTNRFWTLALANGESLRADAVVIATGYGVGHSSDAKLLNERDASVKELVIHAHDFEAMRKIRAEDDVLILGSGLSAVDVFLQISKQNKNQKISFLSRHGLFPLTHQVSSQSLKFDLPDLMSYSPLQILRLFRSYQKTFPHQIAHFVQQVRLQAEKIWSRWTPREKKSFLNHLLPYWEVARHRVAADVWDQVEAAIQSGRTDVLAGRIQSTEREKDFLRVYFQPRDATQPNSLQCDWIILANGTKIDQSILLSQFESGLRKCEFGFGYVSEGAPNLWLVGPSKKGAGWETTAIPEIAQSALRAVKEMKAKLALRADSTSSFCFHPEQIEETYFEHFQIATSQAFSLVRAAWILCLHALFPFKYTNHTSDYVRDLDQKITARRRRKFYKAPIHSEDPKKTSENDLNKVS